MSTSEPLIRLRNIAKYFGNVTALEGVSAVVNAGEVTCVLGDNGAGKSTFIKILSGLHKPSSGEYLIDGVPVAFESPRDARERGIATVYQDLAITPLMSIWRNFFLGAEPMRSGVSLAHVVHEKDAKEELAKMGIDIRDVDQPVGRCRVASASRWRFHAPCTTARACSSWTSPPRRSASVSRASCCATSSRRRNETWCGFSLRTTQTTPTRGRPLPHPEPRQVAW